MAEDGRLRGSWRRSAVALLCVSAALAVAAPSAQATSDARRCAPGIDHPALADPVCVEAGERYAGTLCAAIERYALSAGLPPGFFARLIWKESLFDARAVSPKGAEGVAQFMPATARRRGLRDAFDPAQALRASALYLAELDREFDGLGLAAAAYNAGEARVRAMIAGARGAPYETQDYVASITGLPVESWLKAPPPPERLAAALRLDAEKPFRPACESLAATRRIKELGGAARSPWGVRLAAHRRPAVARRFFERLRARHGTLLRGETAYVIQDRRRLGGRRLYSAYVGRPSRGEALALCRRLRAAGLGCVVRKT